MKRFAWWVFFLFLYAYAVSSGWFSQDVSGSILIVVLGLAVLLWPVWVFLRGVVRPFKVQ